MYRKKIEKNNSFSLEATFDCGQCFRFDPLEDGSYFGIASDRTARFYDEGENIIMEIDDEKDFPFWADFLDLGRDYGAIVESLKDEPLLYGVADFGRGIRILNQDPWEALCSFIISQNNNIPRIKGIISRLCENFGGEIKEGCFSFPSAERLSKCSPEELAPLRAGFRVKYILDAAKKVASGEIILEDLRSAPFDEAKEKLKTICGVGDKVANCVLLFGLGHINAFPVDVWIRRIMECKFPNGLPDSTEGVRGIIQQYLFYYYRIHPEELEEKRAV